jgi:GNAT superfamily N-acetyltransferase
VVEDSVFSFSALQAEIPLLVALIREFASEQGIHEHLRIDEDRLERALFGMQKTAEVLIGYQQGQPLSYSLFYSDYLSFVGETGLHLEDLYVRSHVRGNGIGANMMRALARIASDRGQRKCSFVIHPLVSRVARHLSAWVDATGYLREHCTSRLVL